LLSTLGNVRRAWHGGPKALGKDYACTTEIWYTSPDGFKGIDKVMLPYNFTEEFILYVTVE